MILAMLLYFPVLAQALKVKHDKPGEFASPQGEFNFEFGPDKEDLTSHGLLPKDPIFIDKSAADFSSAGGIFTPGNLGINDSGINLDNERSEFSSAGIISNIKEIKAADEAFDSPDQGDFVFTFSPKKKKRSSLLE